MAMLYLLVLVSLAALSQADIIYYIGVQDGNWSNVSAWNNSAGMAVLPGPSDTAVWDDTLYCQGCQLIVDIPVTVQVLILNSQASSSQPSTFAILNTLTVDVFNTTGSGALIVNLNTTGLLVNRTNTSLFWAQCDDDNYAVVNFWGGKNISFRMSKGATVNVYNATMNKTTEIAHDGAFNVYNGTFDTLIVTDAYTAYFNGTIRANVFTLTNVRNTLTWDAATLTAGAFTADGADTSQAVNKSVINVMNQFYWLNHYFQGPITVNSYGQGYIYNYTTNNFKLNAGAQFTNLGTFYWTANYYSMYSDDTGIFVNQAGATIVCVSDYPGSNYVPTVGYGSTYGIDFYNYGTIDCTLLYPDRNFHVYEGGTTIYNTGKWLGNLFIERATAYFQPGMQSNDPTNSFLIWTSYLSSYPTYLSYSTTLYIQTNINISNGQFTGGNVLLQGVNATFINSQFGTSGNNAYLNATGNQTATLLGTNNMTGLIVASAQPNSLTLYVPDGQTLAWQSNDLSMIGSARIVNNGTWLWQGYSNILSEANTTMFNYGNIIISYTSSSFYWYAPTTSSDPSGTMYNLGVIRFTTSSATVRFSYGQGHFYQCGNGQIQFYTTSQNYVSTINFADLHLGGSFVLLYSGSYYDPASMQVFDWQTPDQAIPPSSLIPPVGVNVFTNFNTVTLCLTSGSPGTATMVQGLQVCGAGPLSDCPGGAFFLQATGSGGPSATGATNGTGFGTPTVPVTGLSTTGAFTGVTGSSPVSPPPSGTSTGAGPSPIIFPTPVTGFTGSSPVTPPPSSTTARTTTNTGFTTISVTSSTPARSPATSSGSQTSATSSGAVSPISGIVSSAASSTGSITGYYTTSNYTYSTSYYYTTYQPITGTPSAVGAIVGGIIGGLVLLAIIAVVIWMFVFRPRAQPQLREQLL